MAEMPLERSQLDAAQRIEEFDAVADPADVVDPQVDATPTWIPLTPADHSIQSLRRGARDIVRSGQAHDGDELVVNSDGRQILLPVSPATRGLLAGPPTAEVGTPKPIFPTVRSSAVASRACAQGRAEAARHRRPWDSREESAFELGVVVDTLAAMFGAPEHHRRVNPLVQASAQIVADRVKPIIESALDLDGGGWRLSPETNVTVPGKHMIWSAWGLLFFHEASGRGHHFILGSGAAHDGSALQGRFAAAVLGYSKLGVQHVTVTHVRVTTGDATVIFQGATPEADADLQSAAHSVLAGGDRTPGRTCSSCPARGTCPALPNVTGALGVVASGNTGVRITGSRLTISDCAGSALMTHNGALALEFTGNAATDLGSAVHHVLATRHNVGSATNRGACSPGTALSDDELSTLADAFPDVDRSMVEAMVVQHTLVCEQIVGEDELRVHPVLMARDPLSDVILTAEADLMATSPTSTVLVDHKLRMKDFTAPPTPEYILTRYPVFAAYILLLHEAANGTSSILKARVGDYPHRSHEDVNRVWPLGGELAVAAEVITPSRSHVVWFDATDPAVLREARRIVADKVALGIQSISQLSPSTTNCGTCGVAQLCTSAVRA